jgi:hypothetical protein
MAHAPLRACPTCTAPLGDIDLGLRDYRWVAPKLPGRVAPTDLDFVLERHGKVLIQEYKPKGVRPGRGQAMTLETFRDMGADVWVVSGNGKDGDFVEVDTVGDGLFNLAMTVDDLADSTVDWFESA